VLPESVNRRRTVKAMTKRKTTKGHTMIYKTLDNSFK